MVRYIHPPTEGAGHEKRPSRRRESGFSRAANRKPGEPGILGTKLGDKKRPGHYNPRNYSHRRFDAFFRRHLQGAAGRTMLEVGCAQSSWLPYFHLAYGCRVTGMDYSPTGCRMAKQLLDEAGAPGEVLERDLFADNSDLEGTFDFLFSLGFIEHFEDTAGTLARMRRFLKPGGTILTIVPNFPGWLGVLQKRVHPEVYGMHILLDLPDLERVHRDAGFTTVEAAISARSPRKWSSIPIPLPCGCGSSGRP